MTATALGKGTAAAEEMRLHGASSGTAAVELVRRIIAGDVQDIGDPHIHARMS
jgi:hypothetical protein